ncbi:MAG: GxxExxY protein [Gemmatimonadaceae bacterium]
MPLLLEELTRSVIGRFYAVYDRLGYGLLENPYVGALEIELKKAGHEVAREMPIAVRYEGVVVGSYRIDLLVDRQLLVEVKAEPCLTGIHERQLRNYLACSDCEVGLVLCFGIQPQFKRFIHTQDRKVREHHVRERQSRP